MMLESVVHMKMIPYLLWRSEARNDASCHKRALNVAAENINVKTPVAITYDDDDEQS